MTLLCPPGGGSPTEQTEPGPVLVLSAPGLSCLCPMQGVSCHHTNTTREHDFSHQGEGRDTHGNHLRPRPAACAAGSSQGLCGRVRASQRGPREARHGGK